MIVFPNAKINIGLRIVERRPDGYHNIESIMVPVGWCDILEIVPSETGRETLTVTGSAPDCPPEKNLVIKALRAVERYTGKPLPTFDIYLHKVIPDGAGLGGGSSDASSAIMLANELAGLGLSKEEMAGIAAGVGADCPFYIYNRPMYVCGIGDILTPVELPALAGLGIAIVKPDSEAVSTKEAYAGVTPAPLAAGESLPEAVGAPVAEWKLGSTLRNDFEASVFPLRPKIGRTLARLREYGPLYSAMTGSGAAVFGIFESVKMAEEAIAGFDGCRCFAGTL